MRLFGLIGFPLGHSFSSGFFSEKFREDAYEALYNNYEISSLSELMNIIDENSGLEGLNVTLPYKKDILKYLDEIDPLAADIGAVNVIKIERGENKTRLKGYNTDVLGFMGSLKPILNNNISHALVLGTGGSSLSVIRGLRELGIQYKTVSRSSDKGDLLYEELGPDLISKHKLIINTTPLGMFPNIEDCPNIPYQSLSNKNILFDLVYNPALTTFLTKGREMGCTTLGGIEMLHIQAEEAWKIWNSEA